MGINFINNYILFWTGRKPKTDSIRNIIGDTYIAIIGWLSAYCLGKIGKIGKIGKLGKIGKIGKIGKLKQNKLNINDYHHS